MFRRLSVSLLVIVSLLTTTLMLSGALARDMAPRTSAKALKGAAHPASAARFTAIDFGIRASDPVLCWPIVALFDFDADGRRPRFHYDRGRGPYGVGWRIAPAPAIATVHESAARRRC